MKKVLFLIMMMISLVTLSSCKNQYNYVEGKVNIVATTTMLGDLSKQIGGDKVSVTALMGIGVDPHLYSAKASDTKALEKSDFIIYGGLHLEGKMVNILESLSKKKSYVNAGESISVNNGVLLFDDKGNTDPHVWFNIENWIIVAKDLTDKLAVYDAVNAEYYQERGAVYIEKLQELHMWTQNKISELSQEKRILVTAHDAFQYFANAYGFEVEAIQGISTESEASINDINNLVNLVIQRQVKAIFIESSVPQKTIDSVVSSAKSKGYTLVIGGELYSDSLGDEAHSEYIAAMKHNVTTIVDSLK